MQTSHADSIQRATSRAQVLTNLDRLHGRQEKPHSPPDDIGESVQAIQDPVRRATNPVSSQQQQVSLVVQQIQEVTNNRSEKTTKFLTEILQGKSIVLENTRAQTEASKFVNRAKINLKRKEISMSNKKMKQMKLLNVHEAPNADQLEILNRLWKEYTIKLIDNCKSASQLQSRLNSAELIGANIVVLEYTPNTKYVCMKGVITAVTKNCYCFTENTSSTCKVHQLIKDDAIIGIILPRETDNIFVIKGANHRYKPNKVKNANRRKNSSSVGKS